MFANLPTRRFGVEIEFVGVTPEVVVAAIVAAGVVCRDEGYNHDTRATWKVVRDGSLAVSPGMPYGACGELVSPPLSGVEGIEQVRTVLRALASCGATVNRSCGLHVHVDAGDLSPSQIGSILRRYSTFQGQIDNFMPASRRNSRWARRIDESVISTVEGYANAATMRRSAGYLDRYYAVNAAAFARHGTVEFRQHSGSVNAGKVARWVAFCLFFVAASLETSTVAGSVAPVAAVPAGRGRRPNFAARREVVRLMSEGVTLPRLAELTGYTEGTLQASILGALRGMGRVSLRSGVYRFTSLNATALNAWLGNSAPVAPVAVAPVAAGPDSLGRGMPAELLSYYSERAMDLDPR
jgi:hypothetical protein